jgi:hypothetical protein
MHNISLCDKQLFIFGLNYNFYHVYNFYAQFYRYNLFQVRERNKGRKRASVWGERKELGGNSQKKNTERKELGGDEREVRWT